MPRISTDTLETFDGSRLAPPVIGFDQAYFDVVRELVEGKSDERDALLNQLFENPHEALVAEVAYMHSLYKDRTVSREMPDGSTEIQFATRKEDEKGVQRLDDRYTIRELNDGTLIYSIKVATFTSNHGLDSTKDYSEGFECVLSDSDILTMRLVRGDYTIPVRTSEDFTQALIETFERTTATAALVMKRRAEDPAAARRADEEARDLLELELGL